MAEAVFARLVADAGLSEQIEVDSAGTGSWHVGESAHPGTRRVLKQRGIEYVGRARQITQEDVDPDTYIIAMDQSNIDALRRRFGDHPRTHRLLDFALENDGIHDVPDPYYSGNFDYVYQLVEDGARGLLEMIREEEQI